MGERELGGCPRCDRDGVDVELSLLAASPARRIGTTIGSILPAFIYWPYAVSEEWPELGEGGRTACAGPVFYWQESYEKTNGFPKHFDRSLLFWDWQRPFIKWARLDAHSDLQGLEPFAPTAFVTANTDDHVERNLFDRSPAWRPGCSTRRGTKSPTIACHTTSKAQRRKFTPRSCRTFWPRGFSSDDNHGPRSIADRIDEDRATHRDAEDRCVIIR